MDLLLALSQIVPCCDGDGGSVVTAQGRHSDVASVLEEAVRLCVEPPTKSSQNIAQDLYERDPQQFHRTAKALGALRHQRPLFRDALRQAFSLDGPKETGFKVFEGAEWVVDKEGGAVCSDKETAVNFKTLMEHLHARLEKGVSSLEVSAVESLFYWRTLYPHRHRFGSERHAYCFQGNRSRMRIDPR